ncbi:hypothetical protein SEVIR_1G022600v4 [Setaria viridis]|uniref:Peroxidase n=1 Tax=Setaria viridis TaxID=4556 RepID=A0A4U6W4Q2_SETVI|nr:cationic peroxidase 1-like [Setaria viridis]TKW37052.1 hypothetical protein SEVIR_1G022600v2 [Setaria viridis]
MASSTAGGHCFLLALLLLSSAAYGQLSEDFYAKNCSKLGTIVKEEVSRALSRPRGGDPRMGASLLRLFFHDCLPQGCDASVLLDMNADVTKGRIIDSSEKQADPNRNSLRGFEVIDRIKGEVEKACRGVVSCADILALATRAAVVELKGPTWPLLLGRRDSTTANVTAANTALPGPNSNLDELIEKFQNKGFNARDLVALSGAHTIGRAQCQFAEQNQQARCLLNGTPGPLDVQTPEVFDNSYYGNLPERGLLHSDRVLTSREDVKVFVEEYKSNQTTFFRDFAIAMERMSRLGVLTGTNGQIRTDCRRVLNN